MTQDVEPITDPTQDADDGGADAIQSDKGGQSPDAKPTKTFTQEELDGILASRLTREQTKTAEKYADYDALKEAATEWQKLQDEKKSELEKLQEKLKAEQAKTTAMEKGVTEFKIRSAFVTAASKLDATHPEDAYALADMSEVKITDEGVTGVDEQVKALVESGRLPKKSSSTIPDINAGAGGKQTELTRTDEEKREFDAIYGVSHRYIE